MSDKKLEAGEYIYREGDVADAAYIVISGKVEIISFGDNGEDQVDVIEPGKAFGDLALFDPLALRPYSARAMEATSLTVMTNDEFQSHFAQCPAAIQPFLKTAFDKMRATKFKVKKSKVETVSESDISKITIAPASDKLKESLKPIEVTLQRLPFRIGGYPEGGEISRRDQLHLNIAAQDNPLRVSRQHCEIGIENKAIVVTDLGSRFCTRVNGNVIGRGRGTYIAPLKKGANELVLGAADNTYRLTVTCA